jgi:predicted cobalt transporter CbtA
MADIIQARWMKGVAITTTLLAVITAAVSARSTNSISATQLLTSEEGMQWSYLQSKTTKIAIMDAQKYMLQGQLLTAATPEQKQGIEALIADGDKDRAKFTKQRDEIKAKAKGFGEKRKVVGKQAAHFTISVVLLQIAIMLSSVSALMQRKSLWIIGLMFGCAGIVVFTFGFLMTLKLASQVPILPI